jgi:hypothetical protein
MENYSPKTALNGFRIIHFALLAIPIIFGGIVTYLVQVEGMGNPDGIEVFLYLPGILLIIAFPLAEMLFKNIMKNISGKEETFKKRMAILQSAHLIRISLFESSALLAAVVCMLTGNLYNLAIVGVVVLILIKHTPDIMYLENEIGLSNEEKSALQ